MKKLLISFAISSLLTTSISYAWMNPLSPKDPSDYSLLGSIVVGSVMVQIISSPWLIVRSVTNQSLKTTLTMSTEKNQTVTMDLHENTIREHNIKSGDKLMVVPDQNGGATVSKDNKPVVYVSSKSHLSTNQEISK